MKIVLRDHVEHLGERGDVVTVAAGYARNFLVPKGLAMKATPGNMKVLEQEKRVWVVKEDKAVGEAEALAAKLASVQLSVTKKSGESGTLYGSVTNGEIAEMLLAKGVEIDRRRIVISEPIKTLGEFKIPIRLYRQVAGEVTLSVISDNPNRMPAPEVEDADDDDEDLE